MTSIGELFPIARKMRWKVQSHMELMHAGAYAVDDMEAGL